MKFEIVKLESYSGSCTTVYTVILDGQKDSLFEQFIRENQSRYPGEVQNIIDRIAIIANITGARENFFKINEGVPGDGICALYDDPERELRLYCVRYGSVAIVLGGGGEKKSKKIRKLQDDPKLRKENFLLRKISAMITDAIKEGIIEWSEDGKELLCDEDTIIIEET